MRRLCAATSSKCVLGSFLTCAHEHEWSVVPPIMCFNLLTFYKYNFLGEPVCREMSSSATKVSTTLLLPPSPPAAPGSCSLRPGHACRPPQHASVRLLPSPSPAPTCYTLSITDQHQSTPGAYTPDYCRYRFLNRKIYTLNITVNTGKSIGMSELLLL